MAFLVATSITALIVLYFAIASLITVWRRKIDDEQPKELRLRRPLLAAVGLTIALSIAESTAQAIFIDGFRKEANDGLLADLFFIFTWAVLYLSLTDANQVTHAHYGAFALTLLIRALALVVDVTREGPYGTTQKMIVVLFGAQLLTVLAVCAIAILSSRLPIKKPQDNPETRPLLAAESGEESQKKEDPPKKEESEDEKARNALRDRPTTEYLKAFKVFLPFMWPSNASQKFNVAGMVLCSALQRVVNVLRPLSLGVVVNDLTSTWSVPWRSISTFVLLGFLESNIGIPLVEQVLWQRVENEQELALKRAAYDHIMNLSANFHDSKTTSHIWQAMYHARSSIGLCHDAAFKLAPSVIDLVVGFFVLYTLFGDYMGLLVLSTIVVFIWMTAQALSPRADLYRKFEDAWYEETFHMLDSTQNWYTVAEFGQIPHEKNQFRTKGQASKDAIMTTIYYNRRSQVARYLAMTLAFTAACCLAAVQIANHEQKIGAFVVLTSYWAQLASPLGQLVGEINSASEKLVQAEKLVVLLEKKPEIHEAEEAREFSFLGGAVEFENVHFSYDGTRQASEGVTFRAPPGTMTALVGETGGGKSTLLKLLFRFHDPQLGRVLIDGQDVKDLKLSSFRKHIGWVPQDGVPFNKTVLDNVRYANLDMTDEQVQEACRDAALHDKIMTFTKQYQEKVGERGTKLSGGEKQRLAIARAILKNPDILLLDEATSSVDSVTEALIQASLEKLGKSKTTFVIAHRLSTILKADQILVIEKGKLVQSGKHADLIKQDGAYKKLWESQLKLQADLEEKACSRSSSPTKDAGLKLVDDVTTQEDESKAENGKEQSISQAKRGRKSAKAALRSLRRRISSSRSSRRTNKRDFANGDADDGLIKSLSSHHNSHQHQGINGHVETSVSTTRSPLKADAPDFVPRHLLDEQKDAGSDTVTRPNGHQENGNGTHVRGDTKSESAVVHDEESDGDDSEESEQESRQAMYSRIPRRSR